MKYQPEEERMTEPQNIGAIFGETLRLWRADPLGMLAVTWHQLLLEKTEAQARLRRIHADHAGQEGKP